MELTQLQSSESLRVKGGGCGFCRLTGQPVHKDERSATPEDETSWQRWSGRGSSLPESDILHTPSPTSRTAWLPAGSHTTSTHGGTRLCKKPSAGKDRCWIYLVNFCPKPVFELLLGLPQSFVGLEWIQVSQHTHDPRETVHLTNVEELKRLHLKAKAGIN